LSNIGDNLAARPEDRDAEGCVQRTGEITDIPKRTPPSIRKEKGGERVCS